MKLIIGLGNPGERYAHTRHNVGYDAMDHLLNCLQLKLDMDKFQAQYTIWRNGKEHCLLVKAYTYMNLSGEALLPLMSYYGVAMDEILVIYDDMDLEPGRIRLRQSGSAGGHNGIKSIIHLLGDTQFKRIKLGVGRPQFGRTVIDHVLTKFGQEDQLVMDQSIAMAAQIAEAWGSNQTDFISLMNQYNAKQ